MGYIKLIVQRGIANNDYQNKINKLVQKLNDNRNTII